MSTPKSKAHGWLTVNLGILELSCRNMIIKEHVNLAKRAIFGLGKAKPTPNVAEKVGASIKETSFGSPIPSLAVEKRQHSSQISEEFCCGWRRKTYR
jgi:hypothetical protein